MKRGTPRHWKIDRLMSILRIGRAKAVGHVVMLWDWVGDYACDGNITRCQAEAAAGADWTGNHSKFIDALVQAYLLDRLADGQVVVHDWVEHCEDYIKKRMQRRQMSANGGKCPPTADTIGGQRRQMSANGCLTRQDQTRPDEAAAATSRTAAAAFVLLRPWAEQFVASGKTDRPVQAILNSLKAKPEEWGCQLVDGVWQPPTDSNESIADQCKRLFGGAA